MKLKSKALIDLNIKGEIYDYKLYESLKSLSTTYSQRKSAKELNISHTVFNRRIKKAEKKLGFKLVEIIGSKSIISEKGYVLLKEYEKYLSRIQSPDTLSIGGGHIVSGLLDSIHLPFNLSVYSSNDENAYKLAKRGVIDILALDDPLLAFEQDLDFTPIASDYLVLVANDKSEKIKSINDLQDLNFISVKGTAQRLAWNTLKHYDINYKIAKEVNSQFDAYKLVKNSDKYYSFLNASYFKGNDILKYDTKHVISLIKINEDKKEVDDFIEYILTAGQKDIIKQGFEKLN